MAVLKARKMSPELLPPGSAAAADTDRGALGEAPELVGRHWQVGAEDRDDRALLRIGEPAFRHRLSYPPPQDREPGPQPVVRLHQRTDVEGVAVDGDAGARRCRCRP